MSLKHCPHCGAELTRPTRRAHLSDDEMREWLRAQTFDEDGPNETPCWIWRKHVSARGYGTVNWKGRSWFAHRAAFRLWHGEIPIGMVVRHRNDCSKRCINSDHLHLGTQGENVKDYWDRKLKR